MMQFNCMILHKESLILSYHKTGAICGFAAPNELVSKPAGQWNTLEVHTIEQNYTVIINDEEVIEFIGNGSSEKDT
jgi:hypothetical protein